MKWPFSKYFYIINMVQSLLKRMLKVLSVVTYFGFCLNYRIIRKVDTKQGYTGNSEAGIKSYEHYTFFLRNRYKKYLI